MGKSHPQWSQKYDTISKLMENQIADLRSTYRKTLMMRYETSILGLQLLKTMKQLQQTKQVLENVECDSNEM
ncbi:hypothetical protein TcasGA2_TC014941 [Tribolium castaneum]|uniref:Uncharacterized protein n=1 Tax=Tribolium castaneum TaxID=7070 RepID=D2A3V4_TRICA|nr:hypothetical protein TcasGA2_TC014941 [Tribolium castaneum]